MVRKLCSVLLAVGLIACGTAVARDGASPVCFSVDGGYQNSARPMPNPAEGLHPEHSSPNDVFSLGFAGGYNLMTEGEIFQSSGTFGPPPDGTNAMRLSGALGIPGTGPIAPPRSACLQQIRRACLA